MPAYHRQALPCSSLQDRFDRATLRLMSRPRFLRWTATAVVIFAVAAGSLYDHWIGFPRHIAGHWVHPRVRWYWTYYPPLGYPYPAIVTYVYTDEQGHEIKHGPYLERGISSKHFLIWDTVVLAKTGFYLEDQPDGVFTEYQTFWGTKLHEARYDHGKQISELWYPVPPLNNAPREK